MNNKKRKTLVRVMAWVLSLLMVGSMGTLLISLLINAIGH